MAETDPLIGATLGEFEVLELIGRGGMGAVYKARQTALERLVAIKTLPRNLAESEDFVARFHREARTAANLRHTHLVQVYAVGEARGVHYIAMEFVDGEGLNTVLKRGRALQPEAALAYLKQTCAGLAVAHESGIVHRDIKPSNLMIDSKGQVRVTDFGLAKRTEGGMDVTRPGETLGTPLYIAPEVAKGENADGRSDLYSLGATFFHLLAGRPPFQGTSYSQLCVQHATEEPPALGELAPHVDRRLAAIIDRLLLKNPESRFASARALLEELEALGTLRPGPRRAPSAGRVAVPSAPTATLSPGKRREREFAAKQLGHAHRAEQKKTRTALIAAGAIAALLVAIGLVAWIATRGGRSDRDKASAVKPPTSSRVVFENPDPREEGAQNVHTNASKAAALGKWRTAAAHLARLDRDYASTKYYAAHRSAITGLRAKIDARYKPSAKPATTKAPQPETLAERAAALGLEPGLIMAFYEHAKPHRFLRATVSPHVTYDWQNRPPIEGVPFDFLSRFVGWLWIEADGTQQLKFWADDGARLYLDGKLVVDAWEWANRNAAVSIALTAGWHRLWVEHIDRKAMGGVKLFWLRDGRWAGVPPDVFFCEGGLLDRARQRPSEDPLTGLRPDEPVAPPGAGPAVRLAKTLLLNGSKSNFEESTGGSAVLVGLRVTTGRFDVATVIYSIQPLFLTPKGRIDGKVHGRRGRDERLLIAKAGYAVGAVVGNGGDRTDGFKAVFMRMREAELDPGDSYESAWVGGRGGTQRTLGGTGEPVVGVHGRTWRDELISFGLITTPRVALPGHVEPGDWVSLFDGKTLDGWEVPREGWYANAGKVEVENGRLVLGVGRSATGVVWKGELPRLDYELAFDAMRLSGPDSFAQIMLPVGRQRVQLCLGAWGGGVVALDPVDGRPGNDNPTSRHLKFQNRRWYAVRVRVTAAAVQVWLDGEQVIDSPVEGHDFRTGPAEATGGLILTTWKTQGAFRNVRYRRLGAEPAPAPRFFGGALRRLPDGRVELRYDFAKAEHLRDWPTWAKEPPKVVDGEVQIGSGMAKGSDHIASFVGDLEFGFTWRIIQGMGQEPNCSVLICRGEGRRFYGFVLKSADQKIVRDHGGRVIGWMKARCPDGEPHKARVLRSGDAIEVWLDDTHAKTMTHDMYHDGTVSLGFWNARCGYRDVRIVGKLDPAWLAQHPDAVKQIAAAPVAGGGGDVGLMVAKPVEPFDETFEDGRAKHWSARAGDWSLRRGELLGSAQGNGWMRIKDRTFGDFVLEADVVDTGQQAGFAYGLIFRKLGRYELMFSMSTEYKHVGLATASDYAPQPRGSVPGVTIKTRSKKLALQPGKRYRVKVECLGTQVRAYLDGELVGEATDRTLFDGELQLFVHRAEVRFDNIRIRPPGAKPAGTPETLASAWEERAKRIDSDAGLTAEEKLRAWNEFLGRWPKVAPARTAQARRRRDHWHQIVAQTLGFETERSKRYGKILRTRVLELADGRQRMLYPGEAMSEFRDFENLAGFAHISVYGLFTIPAVHSPLTAFCWSYDHGDDVKVAFKAGVRRTFGCTIFGLAGDPFSTGVALTIGAEDNRATTLGPPGEKPWYHSSAVPTHAWRRHELETRDGVLVYRYEGKEVLRRKVDTARFKGRRVILWAKPLPKDKEARPRFRDIEIVSAPQRDWMSSDRPGVLPPPRGPLPDQAGWVGMGGWDGEWLTCSHRCWWWVRAGRMVALSSGPEKLRVSQGNWGFDHRDAVMSARCELAGEANADAWDSSVVLVLRSGLGSSMAVSLFRRGGAELGYKYRHERFVDWRTRTLTRNDDFVLPTGVLHLVAFAQGKRLEVYCNGRLALACDDLPEAEGRFGIGVKRAGLIVHDFKWRPLPTDPLFHKLQPQARK